MFEKQTITLTSYYTNFTLLIKQVEALPEIEFTDEMNFRLLSPMVLSTRRERNGKLRQYYLRPEDTEDINRILKNNLMNKFELINRISPSSDSLEFIWDQEYLSNHKRITKKITINENAINSVDIIGMQAPFKIKGNPNLIKVGYECGFGEKNSTGFGMAEIHS